MTISTCCISSLIIFCLLLMWLLWEQMDRTEHWYQRFELMSAAYRDATQTDTAQQLHLAREQIDKLEEQLCTVHDLLIAAYRDRAIVENVHMVEGYAIVAFWN